MSATPWATRSHAKRSLIVITSIALAAGATYSLWNWRAAVAAAQVHVVAGPGPIHCNDGELPVRLADEDDPPTVVVQMNAKPGAWCQVPISVRNDSPHSVTVHDLTFPITRAESHAAGPLVVTDDGSLTGPVGSKESMDAVFKVDDQIEPGDFSTYQMRVETNARACQSAGVSSLPDVPLVRFSVLHREQKTRGTINLQAKITGKGLTWSGCS